MPALPLDLRCNGVNGRLMSTSPSQRGYSVAVSRRCAPPLVPANTEPSTSLPRSSSSSVVTTMKLNRRHSTDGETASVSSATVGLPCKRSRDAVSGPVASSPPEKLSRVSPHAPKHTQQAGVKTVEGITSASTAANSGHLSASSFQQPVTVASETAAPSTLPASPVAPVPVSPVSVPVVLTSVNGMLVPLSSGPGAAIIVVNCAGTMTTSPPQTSGAARLCPIAPAPPLQPHVTKQSEPSSAAAAAASFAAVSTGDSDVITSPTAQRRTYRCEEPGCGKTYFKNSHLKVHRRVHTGLLVSKKLSRYFAVL